MKVIGHWILGFCWLLFFYVENPLIESNDEQLLASEIERDLSEVSVPAFYALFIICFSYMIVSKKCVNLIWRPFPINKKF